MFLGWMEPTLEDVEWVVDRVHQSVEEYAKNLTPRRHKREYFKNNWPIPFDDYCQYARNFQQLSKELRNLRPGEFLTSVKDNAPLRRFLSFRYSPKYTPDFHGWLEYLKAHNENFATVLARISRPSALLEELREEHTLIVAPTKWGKSELIKSLAHHYAVHADMGAVVVLDPHGTMVKQIARWPELVHSNRALLIQPGLQKGKVACLNLLDGRGLDRDGRREAASFLTAQLGTLADAVTPAMGRIARHCFHILLAYEGATFPDFLELVGTPSDKRLRTPRQRALLSFGIQYPDRVISSFFSQDFLSHYEESSRMGLKRRAEHLLQLPAAPEMFGGEAKFTLEQAIEERKFILVDLSEFGEVGRIDVGRLLVAMIGAIVRKRKSLPQSQWVRTQLFIDEAPLLVSDELLRHLKELRKFGLFTTLAQQLKDDGENRQQAKLVAELSAVKFLGSRDGNKGGFLRVKDELPALKRSQFWVECDTITGVGLLNVRNDLANYGLTVPEEEWQKYENWLVGRYYSDAADIHLPSQAELDDYDEEEGIDLTPAETQEQGSYPIPLPEWAIESDMVPPATVATATSAQQQSRRHHGRRGHKPGPAAIS